MLGENIQKLSSLLAIRREDGAFLFLTKYVLTRFQSHKILQTAAGLSYYLMLSFFPFLIFINAIISAMGLDSAEVSGYLADFLPAQITFILESYLKTLAVHYKPGFFLFSFFLSVFSISRSASSLIYGLSLCYNENPKTRLFRNVIASFVFTIFLSVFVLALLFVIAAGRTALLYLGEVFSLSEQTLSLFEVLRWWVVAGSIFFLILLVYLLIPFGRKRHRLILPGTIFSFLGALFLSFILSFYFENIAQFSVIYGSLGAAVAFMLWLYLLAAILLLGGEVNAGFEHLKKRGGI